MSISTPAENSGVPAVNLARARPRELVQANLGLLLVASSQLFFSLMNVGVKLLNSLDPPVPAVEVSV